MNTQRMAPTRFNLLRARRALGRVERGIVLTRKKREALVVELFRIARPAVELRSMLADAVTSAVELLASALAFGGTHEVGAISLPNHEPSVDLRAELVWGVRTTEMTSRSTVSRTVDARGHVPSLTGPSATLAAAKFERLVEMLIEAAPREQQLRRLGVALAMTNRRLRLLEQRMAPTLQEQIRLVTAQLDETEREDQLRIRMARRASSRAN